MKAKGITALLRPLALFMCLGMSMPVLAAGEDFEIEEGVLKRYTGSDHSIIIPDGVTKIGSSAFSGSSLTGVTIPESVSEIGRASCRERVYRAV